jgi:hypothetical protein
VFGVQRFDLRELNDLEVKEHYQVKISNRFAGLENLDDNVDIIRGLKILERVSKFETKRAYVIVS